MPQKIKHLIWKAGNETILMRMNLVKRKININPICPVCKEKEETTLHGLVECPPIEQLWFISPLAIKVAYCRANNFKELLQKWLTFSEIDNKERVWISERIATTCWFIWKQINEIAFENKNFNMQLILSIHAD